MDSNIQTLIKALKAPDEKLMGELLALRDSLPEAQQDQIAYRAGFTHYPEAKAHLVEHGLELCGSPPFLLDTQKQKRHYKILKASVWGYYSNLCLSYAREKYAGIEFENSISPKNISGNPDIQLPESKPEMPWPEYFRLYAEYMSCFLPGLRESVVNVPFDSQTASYRFFFACVPGNRHINHERLLCNCSAIILAPGDDPAHNFSHVSLQKAEAVHPFLKQARWFLVDNGDAEVYDNLLKSVGATYELMPDDEEFDYFDYVVNRLMDDD